MTQDNIQDSAEPHQPHPGLRSLEKLVGTWNISGGAQGQITYEWLEGGYFLMQRIDLVHDGRKIKGIEIIGHLHPLGGEPSPEIWTRVYSFLDGLTLDYVYEVTGSTFTIWGGYKGSPAAFRGKFSDDGNSFSGGWQWPGGGYDVTGTRVR